MKVQIRKGVFETNSSSTHCLAVYKKSEWQDFQSGKLYMERTLGPLLNEEEVKEKFKQYCCKYGYEETVEKFENWKEDWLIKYLYEDAEVLEEEVPDSDYIAVSYYNYE